MTEIHEQAKRAVSDDECPVCGGSFSSMETERVPVGVVHYMSHDTRGTGTVCYRSCDLKTGGHRILVIVHE